MPCQSLDFVCCVDFLGLINPFSVFSFPVFVWCLHVWCCLRGMSGFLKKNCFLLVWVGVWLWSTLSSGLYCCLCVLQIRLSFSANVVCSFVVPKTFDPILVLGCQSVYVAYCVCGLEDIDFLSFFVPGRFYRATFCC